MAAKRTTKARTRGAMSEMESLATLPGNAIAPIAPAAIAPVIVPRNRKELAEAIVAPRSLVQVGRELLASTSEKGASVQLRVYEMLVEWQYGPERAAGNGAERVRIVWDIPRPKREIEDISE